MWKLDAISGTVNLVTGAFSGSGPIKINNVLANDASSELQGSFYGPNAEALGGSFKAGAQDKTAIGVFKAVRP